MSTNDKNNWQVLLASLLLTGVLSIALLVGTPLSDENIRVPMRLTAQIAFGLYLVILVARPLQQLLSKTWTATLLRNRRLIGVAFAAVMTTHLVLIVYRFGSQTRPEKGDWIKGVETAPPRRATRGRIHLRPAPRCRGSYRP